MIKIAIPVHDGMLSAHFGHCEKFSVFEVDENQPMIVKKEDHSPPAHEPGALPRWLASLSVNLIIAGGMGQRAQQLFSQSGIDVLVGAPHNTPDNLVSEYLAGTLQCGQNVCDH